MDRKTAMAMGPDVYAALYGPGWENIAGSPEATEAQSVGTAAQQILDLIRINPEAWDQALAAMPRSNNIEDRRQQPVQGEKRSLLKALLDLKGK